MATGVEVTQGRKSKRSMALDFAVQAGTSWCANKVSQQRHQLLIKTAVGRALASPAGLLMLESAFAGSTSGTVCGKITARIAEFMCLQDRLPTGEELRKLVWRVKLAGRIVGGVAGAGAGSLATLAIAPLPGARMVVAGAALGAVAGACFGASEAEDEFLQLLEGHLSAEVGGAGGLGKGTAGTLGSAIEAATVHGVSHAKKWFASRTVDPATSRVTTQGAQSSNNRV